MRVSPERIQGCIMFFWCCYAFVQVFVSPDRYASVITFPEIVFLLVFIVSGYFTAAFAFFVPLKAIFRRAGEERLYLFSTAFIVVLLELYWISKNIMAEQSFMSAGRMSALAGSVAAAAISGFLLNKVSGKAAGKRVPAKSSLRSGAVVACVFTIMAFYLYSLSFWNLHLFRSGKIRVSEKPNVVLVTIDTLSANYTGMFGYNADNTPALDNLASESVVFRNMLSMTPITGPSHSTILTGVAPAFHGVYSNGIYLDDRFTTVAEILMQNGYTTAQFVNVFVCGLRGGLHQGFEVSFLGDNSESPVQRLLEKTTVLYFLQRFLIKMIKLQASPGLYDENYYLVEKWLDSRPKEPFFLWFHSYIPHTPYDPPPELKEKFGIADASPLSTQLSIDIFEKQIDLPEERIREIRALYAAEILHGDRIIARLGDKLKEKGLYDNTLLIVTSDHGEEIMEHDRYIGHANQLRKSTSHVPCVIKFPGGKHSGAEVNGIANLSDIAPTILETAGYETPIKMDGASLIPAVSRDKNREYTVMETFPPYSRKIGVLADDYIYIMNLADNSEEMYSWSNDPFSTKNLLPLDPDSGIGEANVDDLKKILAEWMKKYPYVESESKTNRKTDKLLKELGYIN